MGGVSMGETSTKNTNGFTTETAESTEIFKEVIDKELFETHPRRE
jgi:hypothetical protein